MNPDIDGLEYVAELVQQRAHHIVSDNAPVNLLKTTEIEPR